MNRIVVIGLGGIGSALVPPLARYLNSKNFDGELILIDGDTFDMGNLDRQNMEISDVYVNKADATARKLISQYPKLEIGTEMTYIKADNASMLLRDGDIVFLCVDNHATRKLISDFVTEFENIVVISSGNELIDGNVQLYVRKDGQDKTASLTAYHSEIENPKDKNPGDLSCEELSKLPSGGQIIFANLTAAVLSLNLFYTYTEQSAAVDFGEVYFDITKCATVTFKRNP